MNHQKAPRAGPRRCREPARSIAVARLGPNGLKINKETTHVIVRWTQVDGVTLHDGTPRAHRMKSANSLHSTRPSPVTSSCLNKSRASCDHCCSFSPGRKWCNNIKKSSQRNGPPSGRWSAAHGVVLSLLDGGAKRRRDLEESSDHFVLIWSSGASLSRVARRSMVASGCPVRRYGLPLARRAKRPPSWRCPTSARGRPVRLEPSGAAAKPSRAGAEY